MKKQLLSNDIGWKVMRLTLLQLLLVAIFTNASVALDGKAQEILDRKITLNIVNKNIKDALNQIENSAGVKFSYSPDLIQANRKVTISAVKENLSTVLETSLIPFS
ncbi:hypothetical protein ACFFJX_30220 [Pseudarcicella hirudinis]|uniref:hypothetical protein n=1 Tax=Pseudarcicella hirudinis TaxID=1079859 RepID=UPI0035E5D2A0